MQIPHLLSEMVSFYKSEILCLKKIKQTNKTFSGGKIMEAISQPYMEIMYIDTITLSEINICRWSLFFYITVSCNVQLC